MAANKSPPILLLFFFFFSSTAITLPQNPNPKMNFPPKDPPVNPFCPRNELKLASCIDLLGVVDAVAGGRISRQCCSLIEGLGAAEAASCICAAIKENALGINVEWDVGLSILVSSCKKKIPDGFKCV